MDDQTLRKLFGAMVSVRGRRLLHSYQDGLLRRQVSHAAANCPYYRQKFGDLGLDPRSIRTAHDLPKLGFYTFPSELQEDPYNFLSVAREQILYAMSSSGTTCKPKIVFLTAHDWEVIVRTACNALAMMGVTARDVVQIMFAFANLAWMTGPLAWRSLERLGAFVLPVGNSISIPEQIETMQRFGTTILMSTPSYMHRLTEEGRKLCDLRSLKVRLIRLGVEPWSEAMRQYLQDAWGAEVYDAYGMMELGAAGAGECRALQGLHLSPYLLVEVVDPKTGALLPRGEMGELVFTTLNRQATPLLRYRSGDLGSLLPDEPCPCGELPTDRISRIAGRIDDMLFLGTGENTFPAHFETALMGIDGLTGFQVVIYKEGYRDRIRIRAETAAPGDGLEQAIVQGLYGEIHFLEHEIYQSQTICPLEVEFLETGTLHRESPTKVRTLIDRRSERET